ncbi:LacI family DNA-binding transcriptional regulator, partial [Streptomyces sp. NPDC048551]|uniref:LacI family DNA-binding transcriptional regulator n=1 Tax=Streptomyces sp. NPDC048551 TaxID=3155758 RepID=UPI0034315E56
MSEQRATLAVIAAEAGVSQATVSKVINGRSDVAPATRERIEGLLRSHNYLHPGRQGRARRSGLVDLIIGGLDSAWAVEILRGVEAECAQRSVGTVVSLVPPGEATPSSWAALPVLHHSDGVILVTASVTQAQRAQVEQAGVALVVIDPIDLPGNGVPSIGATNWAGGLAATEHLLELGHRRIATIGGRKEMLCSQARIDGYRAALERAGIEVDRDLIRFGDFQHEGGFQRARELLALPEHGRAMASVIIPQAFRIV